MTEPVLIGLDWGTTSLRAYLLGKDGSILDQCSGNQGILNVPAGKFEATAEEMLRVWTAQWGDLPVIASGMIGSRQGWQEVPYVPTPAGLTELAAGLQPLRASCGREYWLVPGCSDRQGDIPDVMRGEETQLLGLLEEIGKDALVVLPGTHSKWVRLREGVLEGFATCMTGELYAVLVQHSILGRLMQKGMPPDDAFVRGVCTGMEQTDLLHQLFGTRTLGLFDEVPAEGLGLYLSGLLIGSEIREGRQRFVTTDRPETIWLVGSSSLVEQYQQAFRALEQPCRVGPAHAAACGLFSIGQSKGLI